MTSYRQILTMEDRKRVPMKPERNERVEGQKYPEVSEQPLLLCYRVVATRQRSGAADLKDSKKSRQ